MFRHISLPVRVEVVVAVIAVVAVFVFVIDWAASSSILSHPRYGSSRLSKETSRLRLAVG